MEELERSSFVDSTDRELLSTICADALTAVDDLSRTSAQRIRSRTGRSYGGVATEEHQDDIATQYRALLEGIRDRRGPTTAEVQVASRLGERRASQGVGLEDVVAAYHVGYQALWDDLVRRVRVRPLADIAHLLPAVDVVWSWVQSMSAAAAVGYATAEDMARSRRHDLGRRFLDGVLSGTATPSEIEDLARAVGFAPDGSFQAIRITVTDGAEEQVVALRREAERRRVPVHIEQRDDLLVIGQTPDLEDLVHQTELVDARWGVGLRRSGIPGLQESLQDAGRCVRWARASDQPVVRFEDSWFTTLLFDHRDELTPLLENPAREAGHLRDAVHAFAEEGFSITRAADRLHLHANSVKYRLDRWKELTGWDPTGFDGLIRSLAAITANDPYERGRNASTPR